MDRRQLFALAAATAVGLRARAAVAAEGPPKTWDGLVLVPSKKLKLLYLAPGADFSPYTKVMLDPTEIAFDQKWLRNYNDQASFQGQVTSGDIRSAVNEGVKRSADIFEKAFTDGGYPVVTTPGPDVMRVRTAIIDIQVAAPDVMTMGRTFSSSSAAGAATFVIEVRDSQSGAILGRAVDSRLAGDNNLLNRNSASNWRDFRELAKKWAQISVAGLTELKTHPPVPETAGAG